MTFSFQSSLFDLVLLLIVDRCHSFSRLLMPTDPGICGHITVSWEIILIVFLVLLVPDTIHAWFVRFGLQLYGI